MFGLLTFPVLLLFCCFALFRPGRKKDCFFGEIAVPRWFQDYFWVFYVYIIP